MFRRVTGAVSVVRPSLAVCGAAAPTTGPSAAAAASPAVLSVSQQQREHKVRYENYFSREGIPHAKRISWAPHTTPKKQGAFVKLGRSNFYDRRVMPMSQEPFNEEEIEAHRLYHRPDVYIYKYNVSATHMQLRP